MRLCVAAVVAAALGLAGCSEPEVVTPLRTEVPEHPAAKKKTPTKRPSRQVSRIPHVESRYSEPAPPPPTPTPKPPLVLRGIDLGAENGRKDGEEGWCLWANGVLSRDNVKVEFPVREVVLQMKGDEANGVWPEVIFNMYNRTTKENYFPVEHEFVTTSTYHEFRKRMDPPMSPGEYLVAFRFLNNFESQQPKADRNVYLKKILLVP